MRAACRLVVAAGLMMTVVFARYSMDNALPSVVRSLDPELYVPRLAALPLAEPFADPPEDAALGVPDEVLAGIDESRRNWIRVNLDALEMVYSVPLATLYMSAALSSQTFPLREIIGFALIAAGSTGMRLVMLDASHSLSAFDDWARKVVDFIRSVAAIHTAGSGVKYYFISSAITDRELCNAFTMFLIGLLLPMIPIANNESLQRSVVELAIRTGKSGAILATLTVLASAIGLV